MKYLLSILFLFISYCSFSQYSDIYKSDSCEEYVYNPDIDEYILSVISTDSITIEIDTLFNIITTNQQVNFNLNLQRQFEIRDYDFCREENKYYFFVNEIFRDNDNRNEEFRKKEFIIEYYILDSLIAIILEDEYSICYYISEKL